MSPTYIKRSQEPVLKRVVSEFPAVMLTHSGATLLTLLSSAWPEESSLKHLRSTA